MGYERFIAGRYMRSGQYFTSVATWITILGVTVGVAVVCFVMSMHNGFETEIRTRLLGTTSHISIFPLSGGLIHDYEALIDTVETVEHVVAASPFIYYKAAVSSASAGDGVIVRGIDAEAEARTSNLAESIVAGAYTFRHQVDAEGDSIPGIIVGSYIADRMGVFLGDPMVMYSLRGEDLRMNTRPRIGKFYVAGLFETGMYEFDANLVYISLASAQDLFRTGDGATAVHLKLTDIQLAQQVAPKIDSLLGHRYDVVPWYVLHKNIFAWIALEKQILFLGFILIVLVAAFSIISSLTMLVLEKRAEIGILKAMGSMPGSVRKIFIYKGLTIGLGGVLGGWILAWAAAWVQNRYAVISLPPDIYFISYLPIETHAVDFVLAGLVTLAICFVTALYPAHQASRLSVIEVLRQ
jgi:lipoprotein-releasing system permease protein